MELGTFVTVPLHSIRRFHNPSISLQHEEPKRIMKISVKNIDYGTGGGNSFSATGAVSAFEAGVLRS
jgi:hypothetical protein